MNLEDRVVGETVAELVLKELAALRSDTPMFRIIGFEGGEVRTAMEQLTASTTVFEQGIAVKVASHRRWEGAPEAWFLDPNQTGVQFRNFGGGLILFEVEEQAESQSLRNMHCIQDGTILDPGDPEAGEQRRRDLVRLAWGRSTTDPSRVLPEDLVDELEQLFHVVARESGQLALRAWVEFLVRCTSRLGSQEGAISRSTVHEAIIGELPWLRLFPDDELFDEDSKLAEKRLVRNVRYAGLNGPTGKELDEEEIERRIDSADFKNEDGERCDEESGAAWRERCLDVVRERSPDQYTQVPVRVWEQIFAKESEAKEGLGTRIAAHIEETSPDRVEEYEDLEVRTALDDQDPAAAKRLLDAEAADPEAEPLIDTLSKSLRRTVEKLANPRSPTVSDPLIALLQRLYDVLGEDEDFETLELKVEAVGSEEPAYTLALFRFLYGNTLREVAEGSDAEHEVPIAVDCRLVSGTRNFCALHTELHGNADESADQDDGEGTDQAVERAWGDLRLALVGQPRDRVLRRFTWSPTDSRGPAGLVGFARLIVDGRPVARVRGRGRWADLDSWCDRMRDPRSELDGDLPRCSENGPVSAWQSARAEAFEDWRRTGLSWTSLSNYVDRWHAILDRASLECVPAQEEHEELEAFLEMETFRPGTQRFVLLATHPIRLRWIGEYLQASKRHLREVLSKQFRLNPEVDELFFSRLFELSPHRQPPVASPGHQALSVATREYGWHEEYRPIVENDTPSVGWVSSIDGESIAALASVVERYLEAHPHKVDGLSILFISRDGEAEHVERLVKHVRSSAGSGLTMTVHVLAPTSSHEEIVRKLESLGEEERGHLDLLPRLRTILHPIELVEKPDEARHLDLDDQVDLVLVPNLFGLKTSVQADTQTSRPKRFDPLLDDPTHDSSGEEGTGRKNVSRDFLPFHGDALLEGWSSLQVWRKTWQRIGKSDPDQVNFFSLQVLFTSSAELFSLLHRWGHWVVTLDPYVGRDQVEASANRPDVITVQPKVGKNGRYTMIVSSDTGRAFIVDRLERQVEGILGDVEDGTARSLANKIYESSRGFAPGVVLRALGLGRTTQEILGLVASREIMDRRRPRTDDVVLDCWLSLDELAHWFGGAHRLRADMLRVLLRRSDGTLLMRLEIVEAKFREREDRGRGEMQLDRTRSALEPAFSAPDSEEEFADASIWRRELVAAINQCAARSLDGDAAAGLWTAQTDGESGVPADLRTALVEGEYTLEGVETILCTIAASDDTLDEEECESPEGHSWFRIGRPGFNSILRRIGGLSSGGAATSVDGQQASASDSERSDTKSDAPLAQTAVEGPASTSTIDGPIEGDGQPRPGEDDSSRGIGRNELERRFQEVLNLFSEFKIAVERPEDFVPVEGPAFYEVRLVPGRAIRSDRLLMQTQELKLRLELPEHHEVRGFVDRGTVVFQIPKDGPDRYYVYTKTLWRRAGHPEESHGSLITPIGEDASGEPVLIDFADTDSPHLLIGGTTGSGKSVALESILEGLCAAHPPERLRFFLVDPKGTELSGFEDRPHLEGEIGMDGEDAVDLLKTEVAEMERRYRLFKEQKKQRGVRIHKLIEYNELVGSEDALPWHVVVLDEYADLTGKKEDRQRIEPLLQRIAQKGRACGIHLIVATQKPSAEILSTAIRSNLPAQLALRVKTASDSRIVMDETGAETLAGKGDAFLKTQKGLVRVQTAQFNG